MSLSHSPSIVTDGLVLHLDAGSKRSYPGSGNTWFDLINKIPTFLINETFFNQNYFEFDGIDDRIESGNTGILNTDGPITIISVCEQFSGTAGTLFRLRFGNESIYSLLIRDRCPTFDWWSIDAQRSRLISSFQLEYYKIYHIAGTLNPINNGYSNVASFYINGNFIDSFTSENSTRRSTDGTLFIGTGLNNLGESISRLHGRIYITQLYKKILSPLEILQNFEATRGRFGL